MIHILFDVFGMRYLPGFSRYILHNGTTEQRNLSGSFSHSLFIATPYFDGMRGTKYEISHLAQTKSKCEGN